MSESFPKHRSVGGGLDLRGRDGAGAAGERPDPLAELARLVGRDDPFRDLFPARGGERPVQGDRAEAGRAPVPEVYDRFDRGQTSDRRAVPSHEPFSREPTFDAAPEDESTFHTPLGQAPHESFRLPALRDGSADPVDPARVGHAFEADPDSPELNADLWAQGMPEPVSAGLLEDVPPLDEGDAETQGSSRRTIVVLLAVVALTVGGLGATFLVRGGTGSHAGSSEPPTIMADTAPTKVVPPDTSNQSTGGDGNTALIEKSASDNVANAKVVNTQEQPADLSQLPPAPATASVAAPPTVTAQPGDGRVSTTTGPVGSNPSPFPEPHKVKTVVIRPDGSVVDDQAAAATAAASSPNAGDAAAGVHRGPVAKPSTPKSVARATSTPKPDTTAADGTASVKPKPVRPAPKPVQTAAVETAPDTTAQATPAAGSFAVQLAAPSTEDEAKSLSDRLQKKFSSELDGHTPSIRKADKGGKSVYRVRVGNLSQDDAKALCAKLQAGGGSCFVVRN